MAGTKLYCLVTEEHVCQQFAQGCTRQRGDRDSDIGLMNQHRFQYICRPQVKYASLRICGIWSNGIDLSTRTVCGSDNGIATLRRTEISPFRTPPPRSLRNRRGHPLPAGQVLLRVLSLIAQPPQQQ